jgi:hypothetical protein
MKIAQRVEKKRAKQVFSHELVFEQVSPPVLLVAFPTAFTCTHILH